MTNTMSKNFITSRPWRRKRKQVLQEFNHECQQCKSRGRYERATTVHHDRPRSEYPELALEDTWTDANGVVHQNLIPLCFQCHEEIETERGNRLLNAMPKEPLTQERW